jgi:hypothetical protein
VERDRLPIPGDPTHAEVPAMTTTTLLWLLFAAAAFAAGFVLGRRIGLADAARDGAPAPVEQRDEDAAPARRPAARTPTAAPPPAAAGPRPGEQPGVPSSPARPRSGVAPPPASAGGSSRPPR